MKKDLLILKNKIIENIKNFNFKELVVKGVKLITFENLKKIFWLFIIMIGIWKINNTDIIGQTKYSFGIIFILIFLDWVFLMGAMSKLFWETLKKVVKKLLGR